MQMKSTSMQGSRDTVAVLTECMCRYQVSMIL